MVNDENIVLGLLRRELLEGDPEVVVEQVMQPGPATIRPNESLDAITQYLQEREADLILVTLSDGKFVGILYREDAERTLTNPVPHG